MATYYVVGSKVFRADYELGYAGDTLYGDSANNTIYSGSGRDTVYGYAGDDSLDGGTDLIRFMMEQVMTP